MAQPEYGAESCQNMSHSNTSSPMASASDIDTAFWYFNVMMSNSMFNLYHH